MLGELLKKPLGMALLLAGAAGGPYVLYETDAGKIARQSSSSWFGSAQSNPNSWSNPLDPNSLIVPNDPLFSNSSLTSSTSGAASTGYVPSGVTVSYPSYGSVSNQTIASMPVANASSASPAMGYPSTIPNPASPAPATMLTSGKPLDASSVPISNGFIGPSRAVPGGTAELWNYTTGVPTLPQLQQNNASKPIVGGPVRDLRDVIRFDITPGWVAQNFGRVSTVLADVQLDGLRTPLVTGTSTSDMAGTITYYFDNQQILRRVNLQGLTGDPSGIAQLMQQYYHLQPEKTLGGHLYTSRWNNKVTSMLHVAPAPIMYSTSQNSNFTVFLELNQPSMPYGLSQEAMSILQTGHQIQRW